MCDLQLTKRRLIPLAALVLALCLLTACSGTKSAGADPIAVGEAMLQAAEGLPEMSVLTSESEDGEELFHYLSDLDYDKVDGYYFAYAAGGTAEEIAVIRLGSESDAEEAMESLRRHVQNRVGLFQYYEPEQAEVAGGGQILTQGNLVALVISPQDGAPINAFRDYGKS